MKSNRVIWIVLDGVGAGELPDAAGYGDQGAHTLKNLNSYCIKNWKRPMRLPILQALGLERIGSLQLQPASPAPVLPRGIAGYGRATEKSAGKDTTTGHWEMAGLVTEKPFQTFPQGFPAPIVERWIQENQLPGVLGNHAASGTEIIDRLGPEHLKTGKPILYTSADSVWQVAAHEEAFGLERLYAICKSARVIADELGLARVIARPFIGNPEKGKPFERTYRRKDFAQHPPRPTYLDHLVKAGVEVLGIGKISNIFAGHGVSKNIDTEGNADGMATLIKELAGARKGLLFCNLIDFDMLYGHRRDCEGFAQALEAFDGELGKTLTLLQEGDLLLITADHGNDPTYPGTDHTREYAPILSFLKDSRSKESRALDLEIRPSFSDLGATVCSALLGQNPASPSLEGDSFFGLLQNAARNA